MSNLAKRTVVGLILSCIIIIIVFIHPTALYITSILWIALATAEFVRMLKIKGIFLNRFLMVGLNISIPTIFYFNYLIHQSTLISAYNILYLLPALIFFVYAIIGDREHYLVVPLGIFTIFYLGFLPSHLLFLKIWTRTHNFPFWQAGFITLFPLAHTWLNDTAAYLVGSTIGQHKLASKLSPKKTIEGLLGSIIISIIFGLVYLKRLFPDINIWLAMIIGLVLSLSAQLGDLV
ncbi:MAG: phosphatidate cytidylyltransferase, partial [candidate division WOR-3 bacterium]|nr:phosphatidate cytidylyltransferase [candidate division WOR-3 bacterium]